jgi:GH25 family lysozyme M1 (1,4-beta-N-acetylmuramidase)
MSYAEDLAAAHAAVTREEQEHAQAVAELADARALLERLQLLKVADVADVSEHQNDIDWAAYAAVAPLAFVRVNDGDRVDARWTAARVQAMRAADVTVAPYSFARVASPGNGERDGHMEAAMCCWFAWQQGGLRPGDLPLAYDLEHSVDPQADRFNGQPPAKVARHAVQFVRGYRSIRGHFPGLYTNPPTWQLIRPHLSADDLSVLAGCWLWHAEWGVAKPRPLDGLPAASFHQFTSTGRKAGISSTGPVDVDVNRVLVSSEELAQLLIR